MGGDEFALLFTGDDPEELLAAGVDSVHRRIRPPAGGQMLKITISIGMVSVPPDNPATEDTIYRAADKALYEAKERKDDIERNLNLVKHTLPDGLVTGSSSSDGVATSSVY